MWTSAPDLATLAAVDDCAAYVVLFATLFVTAKRRLPRAYQILKIAINAVVAGMGIMALVSDLLELDLLGGPIGQLLRIALQLVPCVRFICTAVSHAFQRRQRKGISGQSSTASPALCDRRPGQAGHGLERVQQRLCAQEQKVSAADLARS